MADVVMCLPEEHEDLSSDSQNPHKSQMSPCQPQGGNSDGHGFLASQSRGVISSKFSKRLSQKLRCDRCVCTHLSPPALGREG